MFLAIIFDTVKEIGIAIVAAKTIVINIVVISAEVRFVNCDIAKAAPVLDF